MMSKRQSSLFFIAIVLFLIGLAVGLTLGTLVTQVRVTNISAIKTIGVDVFSDHNCTMRVASIEWGVLEPGSNTTKIVYVASESNIPNILTITAEQWLSTECIEYMILTAEPNNIVLQPQEVLEIQLTLSIAENTTGIIGFSFDILFSASG